MTDPTIFDVYTQEGLTDEDMEEVLDLIELGFMQGYNEAA